MSEELKGAIRHILTVVGGFLVARGKLDPGAVESIVGVVMAVIGFAWSWIAKKA